MTEKTKLFDKQLSLAQLQVQVGATEALYGPLKALGHNQANSAATYTLGLHPTPVVELRPKAGNAVPDGFSKVCEGKVWVLGQLQDVVAIRKNAA